MDKEKFLSDFKAKNTPVEILGDIVNWDFDVKCKCLLCNEEFYMRPSNLKRGSVHNKCSYFLRGIKRRSSTQEFKERLYKINENIEVVGEYVKATIPIKVKCNICGHTWEPTPNSLLGGHGCPVCYYKKISNPTEGNDINKSKAIYNIPLLRESLLSKFPNLMFLNDVDNLTTPMLCECKKCNNTWETNLRNLNNLKLDECCPYCSGRLLNIKLLDTFLENHQITRNNTPLKWSDKLECVCDACNYQWSIQTNALLKRKGCPKCSNRVRKTHKEFLQKVNDINPNVELLSEYVNAKTKIKRKCKLCGDISEILPKGILKHICKGCASIKSHNTLAKTPEEFALEFYNKYDGYLLIDTYVNATTPIEIKHKSCGCIFSFTPSRIYDCAKHICPYCYPKNSNGEREIQNYLDAHYESYQQHKTFSDLRGINNGYLSYDFYLDKKSILIEYQGIQHYKSIERFGGIERFEIQQEHDKRKREYAKQNNIRLIEIPYWDFENIEEILSKELGLAA